MSTKEQKNAEFLEKIKSLQFVTHKVLADGHQPNCSQCGEPLSKHVKGVLITARLRMSQKRPAPVQESFAA